MPHVHTPRTPYTAGGAARSHNWPVNDCCTRERRFPLCGAPGIHTFHAMTRDAADPAQLSFEDSLAELEKIIEHLERGDVPLADSIRIYKRGAALKARCEAQLRESQLEVEQIVMTPEGPRAEPARLGA